MAKPPQELLGGSRRWSSGLCDCTDDVRFCCITCWCPCVTFGQIAEIVDKGSPSCGASGALYGLICGLTGCGWLYSCQYRSKMRALYDFPDTPCNDCCVHFFCEWCALCQMHRELASRGYDMDIGWHANIERQNAPSGLTVPPAPLPGHDALIKLLPDDCLSFGIKLWCNIVQLMWTSICIVCM